MVSDDFSVAYYTAQVLLEHQSRITTALAVEGLKRWWQHPEYTCYCGPSTRRGILKLLGEEAGDTAPSRLDPTFATNGGGMKAGMMGLFNPGDPAGAVTDAITMCLPTHGNPISLSAACAVAAAAAPCLLPQHGLPGPDRRRHGRHLARPRTERGAYGGDRRLQRCPPSGVGGGTGPALSG